VPKRPSPALRIFAIFHWAFKKAHRLRNAPVALKNTDHPTTQIFNYEAVASVVVRTAA